MEKTNDAGVRHPSTRGVAAAARLSVALLLVSACHDPAGAPIPLTVTADAAATTSGGVITLTSQQFAGITLVPSSDTTRPNRWPNFAVIVGDDTAEIWRVGPTQIAFRVPPVYTGNYEAGIVASGYDEARATFYAIGQVVPVWGGLHTYTNTYQGTAFPPHGLLIGEEVDWTGFSTGYGMLNAQTRNLQMFPELRATGSNRVKMYAVGPSYRANHFIFDLSPTGTSAAGIWSGEPWTLVDSVPCGDPRGNYTAAELSDTTCLLLSFDGTMIRNGTDTLLSAQSALHSGEFRLAPGGEWAVVRTRLEDPPFEISTRWPVLDRGGNIAYTIDTLFQVSGAAFSSDGDTLFVTASVRDRAANFTGGRFTLEVLETATGRVLASRPFPASRVLQDVAVDPTRPLLYLASLQIEAAGNRPYLTVVDRSSLHLLADIPAVDHWGGSDATLVHEGSAGRVSVFGWCGADCGGLWAFTFDLP